MKRFRPNFQALENRRLLAADAALMDEVTEIVAADVNADGSVTARDALEVINELNLAEQTVGQEVYESVVERAAESVARLDVDGDGRVSAVDALRVINRLNTSDVDLVDTVMRILPAEGEGAATTTLRDSVRGLIGRLNSLRIEVNLPRQAIADVVGEVSGFIRDSELSGDLRTDAILIRVENIIERVGIDTDDIRDVNTQVRRVIDSLPSTITEGLDELAPEILETAGRIIDSLDGGISLSSIGDIVESLRGVQTSLRFPSIQSVFSFVDVYRQTTADRSFSDSELSQLRESAGSVLSSAGIQGTLRDEFLDGFDQIIRLRFQ